MTPTRYLANPRAVLQTMPDGSAVVLHLETRFYFRLSETGSFLWQQLTTAGGSTVASLADSLQANFEVDPDEAMKDAETWLAGMLAEQLVVVDG